MVQTWSSSKGEDFYCPHCGAVYGVDLRRIPQKDKDSAICESCGNVMKEWHDTLVPSFKLKSIPTQDA